MNSNNKTSKITMIVITSLTIGLLLIGLIFMQYWNSGLKAAKPTSKEEKVVQIVPGASIKYIGKSLEKRGIVKSGFVFSYYAKLHKQTDFQAGYYTLSPSMDVKQIINQMHKGASSDPRGTPEHKLLIREGETIEQIADSLEKNTSYTKKEFLDLMKNEEFFNKMAKKYPKLFDSEKKDLSQVRYYFEGYLFPATYNIYKGESLKELVEEIVKNTDLQMKKYYKPIQQQNLNVNEVLTLASLVEKEGRTETDRRKIAGVFFNRLKIGMPLQSDVTVLYAKGESKEYLTVADTKYDSPYNLYMYKGYGPGPYNNPGLQSIDAVVYPDKNDYLYFLADTKTGKVYYAKTHEEHLKLSAKYIPQ